MTAVIILRGCGVDILHNALPSTHLHTALVGKVGKVYHHRLDIAIEHCVQTLLRNLAYRGIKRKAVSATNGNYRCKVDIVLLLAKRSNTTLLNRHISIW